MYKDKVVYLDKVVVWFIYLFICVVDQCYYIGLCGKEVMDKKLLMVLIYEGIGKVMFDLIGIFKVGIWVVMVLNILVEEYEVIVENYLCFSRFCLSGYDGFMQDYMFMVLDWFVEFLDSINLYVVVFIEFIMIVVYVFFCFECMVYKKCDIFGVWGDGNFGFIMMFFLKKKYLDSKVFIFGKIFYKFDYFFFVDVVY